MCRRHGRHRLAGSHRCGNMLDGPVQLHAVKPGSQLIAWTPTCFSSSDLKMVTLLTSGNTGPAGPTGGTGCTGASTNCPPGSEPFACAASGCQPCPAGSVSPGGSAPCASCSPSYPITFSGLVGASGQCPSPTTDTYCYNGQCSAVGFTWHDTLPALCPGITHITIQVNGGVNCNPDGTALPATLNGQSLTPAADLTLGREACGCGSTPYSTTVTISGADVQAYAIRGSNTITFDASSNFGFLADSAGAFATVFVSTS